MNIQTETRLRTKDVLAALNVSQSTLYLMMKEGRFPRPFQEGSRLNFWKPEDVEQHIQNTFSGSRSKGQVQPICEGLLNAPTDEPVTVQSFIAGALANKPINLSQLFTLASEAGISVKDVQELHGIQYRTFKPRPHADPLAKLITQ